MVGLLPLFLILAQTSVHDLEAATPAGQGEKGTLPRLSGLRSGFSLARPEATRSRPRSSLRPKRRHEPLGAIPPCG